MARGVIQQGQGRWYTKETWLNEDYIFSSQPFEWSTSKQCKHVWMLVQLITSIPVWNVVLPVPAMPRHITHVGLPAQLVPEDSWLLAIAESVDDTLASTVIHMANIVLVVRCTLPMHSLINQLRMRSIDQLACMIILYLSSFLLFSSKTFPY